jgi:nicotinate-nucleotide pyrophosphorylase (carboxylating)
MSIKDIRKAVRIRNNSSLHPHPLTPKLEASGGVNLANIKQVAACGVDMISLGDLTHSVKSIDISLEVL